MTINAEAVLVQAPAVRARLEALLRPDAEQWQRADEVVVALEPTPLEQQPSAYVQVAWKNRPRGDVPEVGVRALTSATALALRLDWRAVRPRRLVGDTNVYPDACAVLFPADGHETELRTMGSPEHPVRVWYWQAGSDTPFVVTAHGVGSADRLATHHVIGRARWTDGRWQVVLARRFADDGVPLEKGSTVQVAFAVWSGAAQERAGLKSISPQLYQLRLG